MAAVESVAAAAKFRELGRGSAVGAGGHLPLVLFLPETKRLLGVVLLLAAEVAVLEEVDEEVGGADQDQKHVTAVGGGFDRMAGGGRLVVTKKWRQNLVEKYRSYRRYLAIYKS